MVTLDITDVTNPRLLTRTRYGQFDEGNAHGVSAYDGRARQFLLQNDDDLDPRSPTMIFHGGNRVGVANESPFAAALWLRPAHSITTRVVRAAGQGCRAGDYPREARDAIVVVTTHLHDFDQTPGPRALCQEGQQESLAETAGAVAVVHDFRSRAVSPQWWNEHDLVGIPALFTDRGTARAMVARGVATLRALRPSWGYLRVFDAATGRQVAMFDDLPKVHALPAPRGDWAIKSNEVRGDRSYASWNSNGLVALDLRPLDGLRPGNPVLVGQFVPPGAPSRTDYLPSGVAMVRDAFARDDGTILVSDMHSGLWIVRPTGQARP